MKRAISSTDGLNFLHQDTKLFSIIVEDVIVDGHSYRAIIVVGRYGKLMLVAYRRGLNEGFRGKIDREACTQINAASAMIAAAAKVTSRLKWFAPTPQMTAAKAMLPWPIII